MDDDWTLGREDWRQEGSDSSGLGLRGGAQPIEKDLAESVWKKPEAMKRREESPVGLRRSCGYPLERLQLALASEWSVFVAPGAASTS